jgi:hypothetical protein
MDFIDSDNHFENHSIPFESFSIPLVASVRLHAVPIAPIAASTS